MIKRLVVFVLDPGKSIQGSHYQGHKGILWDHTMRPEDIVLQVLAISQQRSVKSKPCRPYYSAFVLAIQNAYRSRNHMCYLHKSIQQTNAQINTNCFAI